MAHAAPTSSPIAAQHSPFVGLTHFTEATAPLFFGRERERKVIISNLGASRLTLLYAESGVGKSSLLRAGVAVRLREFALENVADGEPVEQLPVVFSSWTGDPVDGLIDAIERAGEPLGLTQKLPRTGLHEAVQAATAELGTTLLLILDQFEEYFQYHARQAQPGSFADQLARCVNDRGLRVNVLLSIREDAYAWLGDLFRGRIANVFANHLHLDYLDRAAGEAAIREPLRRFNEEDVEGGPFSIEDDLVDAVLDGVCRRPTTDEELAEAAGDGVETTYLQLVMERLWREERAEGSAVLRLATLERLGGVDEIVETHLNAALSGLSEEQQDLAAGFLRFFVTSTGTKVAWTVDDLVRLSEVPEPAVAAVVRRLSAPGLKILRPVATPGQLGAIRYEIFHDALARPVLAWCDAHADRMAAIRLDRERREKEAAQLQAQEAERRAATERRRRRLALGGLVGLVAAFLVTAVVFALIQRDHADAQRRTAESVQAVQRTSEWAQSPIVGPAARGLSAFAAEEQLAPTFDARNGVLGVLQTNVGLPAVGGHALAVMAVAFVPRSRLVVSGGADGAVRLWDQEGTSLGGPAVGAESDFRVDAVAVTADGLIAAARSDGNLDLWRISERRRVGHLRTVAVAPEGVEQHAAAFSPDGRYLVVGGDTTLTVWRTGHWARPLYTWASPSPIRAVTFEPPSTGSGFLSAGDGGIRRWKVSTERLRGRTVTRSPATSIAVATNGALAYGNSDVGDDGRGPGIELVRRGRPPTFLPTADHALSLAFTPDGGTLVSGADWNVTTFDVRSGREFGPPRMFAPNMTPQAVAVSPDGTTLVAGGDNMQLKFWQLGQPDVLATTIGSLGIDKSSQTTRANRTVYDVAVGPGGMVAAASGAEGVVLWKRTGVRADEVPSPLGGVRDPIRGYKHLSSNAVAFHGHTLAASFGRFIALFDTSARCSKMPREPCSFWTSASDPQHAQDVASLAFDRDGRLLASSDNEGRVQLWEIERPRNVQPVAHKTESQAVAALTFSPTAPLLAVGGQDGTLRVWNTRNPSRLIAWTPRPLVAQEGFSVYTARFSPDGRLLAAGGDSQQVTVWQVGRSPGSVRRVQAKRFIQSNSIWTLAFSSVEDRPVLAAGDADGSVCLYDVASGRSIGEGGACLLGHGGDSSYTTIRDVEFSPDGRQLLTAGDGNPLVAWDSLLWTQRHDRATEQALRRAVCRIARNRELTGAQWSPAFADTTIAEQHRPQCRGQPG